MFGLVKILFLDVQVYHEAGLSKYLTYREDSSKSERELIEPTGLHMGGCGVTSAPIDSKVLVH